MSTEKKRFSIKNWLRNTFFKEEGVSQLKKVTLRSKPVIALSVCLVTVFCLPALFSKSQIKQSPSLDPVDLSDVELRSVETALKEKIEYISLTDVVPAQIKEGERRDYDAPQIIMNSAAQFGLPPGTMIPAVLATKVISSGNNNTAIAVVAEDSMLDNRTVIPQGSQLLGQASHDEEARRVQIEFHTVVFPDHRQFSLSARALDLNDQGSSGLSGKYYSKQWQKIAGSLLTRFAGGVAAGLQDRTTNLFGVETRQGSWKNGLLQGTSDAALDQAGRFSESLKNSKGVVEVPQGYPFLVFLIQRFTEN